MGKKKTELDYRTELIEAHNALQEYPDSRALQNTVDKIKERWSNSVAMVFYIPANEKLPYTTEEVGYPCLKMPTQKTSGHYQVGDIVCYLPEHDYITRVAWDRKGGKKPRKQYINKQGNVVRLDQVNYLAMDWYNTTMNTHEIKGDDNKVIHEDNLDRFIRACYRAKAEGFETLVVGVESTFEQFTAYRPNGNIGASVASRVARSRSVRHHSRYFAHVEFYGSREAAITGMLQENRWWIKDNFVKILKLEK